MAETVLITGAARGLGLALCRCYLRKGDAVVACIRGRHSVGLDALAEEFGGALHVLTDIDVERDTVEQTLSVAARAVSSRIDILINNAAVLLDDKVALADLSMEDALRSLNVNALGALRVTRSLLPLVADGGEIVNISSEAGSNTTSFRGDTYAYCMSKAALNRMSVILQEQVKPRGIRVIVVQPGWMQTAMGGARATYAPDDAAERIAGVIARVESFAHVDLLGNPCEW